MSYYTHQFRNFTIVGNLEELLRRFEPGREVQGRIVLELDENHYLLRIMGYNMLMESRLNFRRFDEVVLRIKQLHPRLILELVDQESDKYRVKTDKGRIKDLKV